MSEYAIELRRSAAKELKALPKQAAAKLTSAISKLANEPRPSGCKKLKSYDNLWRLRSGNYRVIYSIYDAKLVVEVLEVKDRKEAY